MKIAFWSPLHGTGATSGFMAVTAALPVMYLKRVMVTQTHYNLNNLERPLLGNIGNGEFFRDMGVDALMRHFKSGNITEEHILNCSVKMSDNLYLLTGTKMLNREGYENNVTRSMIIHILSVMEKYFDIVMIDTNSGQNDFSMKVIEDCDAVVVSLRQNRTVLEDFFSSGLFEGKRVFYLFSDYDRESKYSIHNLKHLFKTLNNKNSAYLPHCTGYMDAVSDEKVMNYIVNGIHEDTELDESFFFESLRVFVDSLTGFITGSDRAILEKGND